MKKLVMALVGVLFCLTVSAQTKTADISKIVGNWTYSAPEAPYGYQDGKIELKQEKGVLIAKVNIQGNLLTIKDIKVKGNKYSASFYLDGADIDLTLIQEGSNMKGQAYAEGMDIPITFKKVKK